MSKEMTNSIQEFVNNYSSLALVIRKDKDFIHHVEIYNRGVKLFIGKDEVFILALSRAICAIIHFIDNGTINKHAQLTTAEVNRILEITQVLKTKEDAGLVDIFVPSQLENLILG